MLASMSELGKHSPVDGCPTPEGRVAAEKGIRNLA